jgi:T5SS/PEP-CTERM-associated repeat protein
MAEQTIYYLNQAYWAGGSGQLGLNWVTGYINNVAADGTVNFVGWVYGQPGASTSAMFNSAAGDGGTLVGSLTCYDIYIEDGNSYILNGNLSAIVILAWGALTVSGAGSTVAAKDIAVGDDPNGLTTSLTISDGAVVSTSNINVGGGTNEHGTLTVSGAGTTLTAAVFYDTATVARHRSVARLTSAMPREMLRSQSAVPDPP